MLTDYHVGHPAILPKPYFTGLKILEGGQGAGSVLQTDTSVYGVNCSYHQTVTEPEPGRVLREDNVDNRNIKSATTFTVEPQNGGDQSRVTIASDFDLAPGLAGVMERLMNPSVTRRLYLAELEQLDAYLQQQA